MTIPNLKRIKVSSADELRTWLAKNPDHGDDVMVVTCNKKSPSKYVPRTQVMEALADHGWQNGRSFTLIGNLTGTVISRA